MDRTNWQFGRHDINFLVIAIVVGKVSIPLLWKILPRKTKSGNSNTAQRIALTEKLLALIPARDIRVLAMDREFGGKQWLAWLDRKAVNFVLRIKKNTVVGKRLAEEHAKWPGTQTQESSTRLWRQGAGPLLCLQAYAKGRPRHAPVRHQQLLPG